MTEVLPSLLVPDHVLWLDVKLHLQDSTSPETKRLLVVTNTNNLDGLYSSGVLLDADISTQLILSIFNKESPLHDGAIIVMNDKIMAASCVLPVSSNPSIPQNLGLRHRAAIGISEKINVMAFVVSEESGRIAYARNGEVIEDITPDKMHQLLEKILFIR